MSIHTVVELFQSGPKWSTDRPTDITAPEAYWMTKAMTEGVNFIMAGIYFLLITGCLWLECQFDIERMLYCAIK